MTLNPFKAYRNWRLRRWNEQNQLQLAAKNANYFEARWKEQHDLFCQQCRKTEALQTFITMMQAEIKKWQVLAQSYGDQHHPNPFQCMIHRANWFEGIRIDDTAKTVELSGVAHAKQRLNKQIIEHENRS